MIDYTAREGLVPSEKLLKHYVALYDPISGQLRVTEAKKLSLKTCVRQRGMVVDSDNEARKERPTNYSSKGALTHAFGTKKSKKAVLERAESMLLAPGGEHSNTLLSKALLSSMPSQDEADMDDESLIQANKPLPKPDLATGDITQVYALTSLVYPSPSIVTLEQMPIRDWMTNVAAKQPISCFSRFVAGRSTYLTRAVNASPANQGARQTLQILRYILVLIELAFFLRRVRPGKRLPPPASYVKEITGPIPSPLLSQIVQHFCPGGMGPSNFHATLLHSTILALTLHIPPPSLDPGPGVLITEPTDIQQDLNLRPDQVRLLFRELGCKLESSTDADLSRWGLIKRLKKVDGAPAPKFAKLRLPLEFPKRSSGAPAQRRR